MAGGNTQEQTRLTPVQALPELIGNARDENLADPVGVGITVLVSDIALARGALFMLLACSWIRVPMRSGRRGGAV